MLKAGTETPFSLHFYEYASWSPPLAGSTYGSLLMSDPDSSDEFLGKINDLFDKWDQNKSETLCFKEIQDGLELLELPIDEQYYRDALERNGGFLTAEKFVELALERDQQLRASFRELDLDGNGFIDEDEVEQGLRRMGLSLKDVKTVSRHLMRRLDANHDGKISYEEFRDVLIHAPKMSLLECLNYWQNAAILNLDDGIPEIPVVESGSRSHALWINSVAGGGASAVAKTSTAPMERLKLIYQAQVRESGATYPSMKNTLNSFFRDDGFHGLFRGNFVNVVKGIPQSTIKFGTFEKTRTYFSDENGEISKPLLFASGSLAGIAAHTTCFPLEVLRTRITVGKYGR